MACLYFGIAPKSLVLPPILGGAVSEGLAGSAAPPPSWDHQAVRSPSRQREVKSGGRTPGEELVALDSSTTATSSIDAR